MYYKITESKKMENSIIHEIKLLNCKDLCQAQLVCRRWKEIIDLGNLKKKATGKTATFLLFVFDSSKPEMIMQP